MTEKRNHGLSAAAKLTPPNKMKHHVVIEKKVGETPLMALNAWKTANPMYKSVSASYAGRLDPMASGKLLILLGDECKRQKKFTNLDKEYEIEMLLDVGSDTGDALGLVQYSDSKSTINTEQLKAVLRAEKGTHLRQYPHFSSKTVNGKPLFLHALEGTLDDISIPKHDERIYRIKERRITHISSKTLVARIDEFLAKVPTSDQPSKQLGADFRIKAVRASWEALFAEAGERSFVVLTLRVACGSGTYMRSFAGRIGEALGTNALALSINRTKIGKYWMGWWLKQY
jgi:tRNA U55 pseudouridine synthase TruB